MTTQLNDIDNADANNVAGLYQGLVGDERAGQLSYAPTPRITSIHHSLESMRYDGFMFTILRSKDEREG